MSQSSRTGTPLPRTASASGGRPRIKIQIPAPGLFSPATPYTGQFTGAGPQWPPQSPYINPFVPNALPPRSSDFLKQFEGFKGGFASTWDWSKTGLKKGEKSAFLMYDKMSKWSKKWFTHIFLLTVVFLYSVAGAYLFMAIEGKRMQ